MQRTHYTPRGIRRAAAAAAGLNPREWRQLEQLVDSCAWLSAGATVPVGAINATANAVDGVHRLAELGLAEGEGDNLDDRWRATNAGYDIVMFTCRRRRSRRSGQTSVRKSPRARHRRHVALLHPLDARRTGEEVTCRGGRCGRVRDRCSAGPAFVATLRNSCTNTHAVALRAPGAC